MVNQEKRRRKERRIARNGRHISMRRTALKPAFSLRDSGRLRRAFCASMARDVGFCAAAAAAAVLLPSPSEGMLLSVSLSLTHFAPAADQKYCAPRSFRQRSAGKVRALCVRVWKRAWAKRVRRSTHRLPCPPRRITACFECTHVFFASTYLSLRFDKDLAFLHPSFFFFFSLSSCFRSNTRSAGTRWS